MLSFGQLLSCRIDCDAYSIGAALLALCPYAPLHLPPCSHPPPLQAAGWHVVRLDSQTCLQLPCSTLADELGALLMEDPARSSLRFAA